MCPPHVKSIFVSPFGPKSLTRRHEAAPPPIQWIGGGLRSGDQQGQEFPRFLPLFPLPFPLPLLPFFWPRFWPLLPFGVSPFRFTRVRFRADAPDSPDVPRETLGPQSGYVRLLPEQAPTVATAQASARTPIPRRMFFMVDARSLCLPTRAGAAASPGGAWDASAAPAAASLVHEHAGFPQLLEQRGAGGPLGVGQLQHGARHRPHRHYVARRRRRGDQRVK